MQEISSKLLPFELENEEIFHFAEDIEKSFGIEVDGKEEFEEEVLTKQKREK